MTLESSAFRAGGPIPDLYTCKGQEVSPPLHISGVPESAKTLALTLTDPDAPNGTFTHWVVWNIPAAITDIEQGKLPNGALQGANGAGKTGYIGPCPPSGTHHYHFKLYALSGSVNLSEGASLQDLMTDMANNQLILDQTELVGLFSK